MYHFFIVCNYKSQWLQRMCSQCMKLCSNVSHSLTPCQVNEGGTWFSLAFILGCSWVWHVQVSETLISHSFVLKSLEIPAPLAKFKITLFTLRALIRNWGPQCNSWQLALLAVVPLIIYRWPRCCWTSCWAVLFTAWCFNTNGKDKLQNNALLSGDSATNSEVAHPHVHFKGDNEMED